MGKFLIGLAVLVLGAAIGMFLIGGVAGVGVATGLGAGMCSTVEAAMAEGLLTEAEVDQVLTRASADLAAMSSDVAPNDEIVGSAAGCADIMDRLSAAAPE